MGDGLEPKAEHSYTPKLADVGSHLETGSLHQHEIALPLQVLLLKSSIWLPCLGPHGEPFAVYEGVFVRIIEKGNMNKVEKLQTDATMSLKIWIKVFFFAQVVCVSALYISHIAFNATKSNES